MINFAFLIELKVEDIVNMSLITRKFFFKFLLVILVFFWIEFIGYLAMQINSQSRDFLFNKNYWHIRQMLLGNKNLNMLPRYLSLPYLGYVPYPLYSRNGKIDHNEDGYRGVKLTVSKSKKYRILCLGGSTTYGFGVPHYYQAFPHQLENSLNYFYKGDSIFHSKYDTIEVLNAGLEAGTSAEELQQYLFKYRYYNPNVVVIHSGINDAQVASSFTENFQSDYTHYRRINFHLEPLPSPASYLMKSYFFSFIAIRLFYSDFSNKQDEFMYQYHQTYCRWTEKSITSVINNRDFNNYPFYRNTSSLYQEVLNDKAILIVLPSVVNKYSKHVKENRKYGETVDLNNEISKNLCSKYGGVFIEYDSISNASYWIDDCHLNIAGEQEKGKYIASFLIKSINKYLQEK